MISTDILTFWGTGDSMGVPRVYCGCAVCTEARTTGANRRYRSSVLLQSAAGEELLIDCGPDWRTQMERSDRKFIRQALITHAHFDHIAGLPEWADACRWRQEKGHVYAPAEVLQALRGQFSWLESHLVFHDCSPGLDWEDWRIRPWKVCHGKNGYSYAYRFEKKGRSPYAWAYCPDSIRLTQEQKIPLRELDLLVLGTNFYREQADPGTRSVYDMVEALELFEEIRPVRAVLTHMSHDVDSRKDYGLPSFVTRAATGMKLELGRLAGG